MEPLELKVDKEKIKDFIIKNTLNRPTREFTHYSYCGMRAAQKAQALRQKTLGRVEEIEGKSEQDNPLGFYFARVESALIQLANSLSYIGSLIVLDGISSDKDSIIKAANKRLSRLFGTPFDTGIETEGLSDEEKISAHVNLHYLCLQKLTKLHNTGIQMSIQNPHIKDDFSEMLSFLRGEIEHANRIFGRKRKWIGLF